MQLRVCFYLSTRCSFVPCRVFFFSERFSRVVDAVVFCPAGGGVLGNCWRVRWLMLLSCVIIGGDFVAPASRVTGGLVPAACCCYYNVSCFFISVEYRVHTKTNSKS